MCVNALATLMGKSDDASVVDETAKYIRWSTVVEKWKCESEEQPRKMICAQGVCEHQIPSLHEYVIHAHVVRAHPSEQPS